MLTPRLDQPEFLAATPRSTDGEVSSGGLWSSLRDRRRRGAVVMAVVALFALAGVRIGGQSAFVVQAELVFVSLWVSIGVLLDRFAPGNGRIARRSGRFFVISALLIPLCGRLLLTPLGGTAAAWEMVLLSTLGIGAVVLAVCSVATRQASLSVICSGFLTLFATSISDRGDTLVLAGVWVLLCLWWLLANHWERIEVHLADSVRRHHGVRLGMTALGMVICGIAFLASWGRGPATRLLSWGVMPTSGGTKWNDPTARSGVGDGDAVVAAKGHAASFGAVESEIFLQSHQPSLYDVFDDVLGRPNKVRRTERAIALANRQQSRDRPRTTRSQRGDAGFSLARRPDQTSSKPRQATSPALLQWVGPTGVRLALERFDRFDGLDWTRDESLDGGDAIDGRSPGQNDRLRRQEIADRVWFFRRKPAVLTLPAGAPFASSLLGPYRGDAVKIINLQSPRVPAPVGTAAVHVADVDRDDFFGITADDAWFMPGRSRIPELTVVRLLTRRFVAGELRAVETMPRALNDRSAEPDFEGKEAAARLARRWTAGLESDYERVERVVSRLREGFVFDRTTASDSDDPLADFLDRRRGGDHLFATAAAVMLRSLGIESRLVTGFYTSPRGRDWLAGHVDVLADDAHVWAEVLVAEDLWMAIEPTPGYALPVFYESASQRALAAVKAATPTLLAALLAVAVLWWSRCRWGEWACRLAWRLSWPLAARRRVALLVRLLDIRGRLAGVRRPVGMTPRDWIERTVRAVDGSLAASAERFFDLADAVFFGPGEIASANWLGDADRVATGVRVGLLIQSRDRQPVASPAAPNRTKDR